MLGLILKTILREFRGSRRLTVLFILNLTVGLLGFVILDGFKRDFSRILSDASKNMLTADLQISGRRALTEEELVGVRALLPDKAKSSKLTSLYTMAAFGQNSQLVRIKAIEPGHPMYGYIDLRLKRRIPDTETPEFFSSPRVWVDASLALQLGLKPSDVLKLGDQAFEVSDVIEDESGISFAGASLAPTIYIGASQLESTSLIRKGSIVNHYYHFKFASEDIESLESEVSKLFSDPQIDVKSYVTSGQDSGRMLRYLNDYLGLVALTALALAGLGAAYLFQSYLQKKRPDIGILLSLGLTPNQAISMYMLKLCLWGLIGASFALGLAAVLLPFVGHLVADLTPLKFAPTLGEETIVVAYMLGGLFSMLICLPIVVQIRELRPSELFQELVDTGPRFSLQALWAFVPSLVGFYGLAVWQAHSLRIGSVFFGLLLVVVVLFGLIAFGLIRMAKSWHPQNLATKLSVRYITRKKIETMMCFFSIALGTLLLNLIPQLRLILEKELAAPGGGGLPSLFLFDVQEEQVSELQQAVLGHTSFLASPMIRARLAAINGQAFKKSDDLGDTREDQESARMRNRGVNLSYRSDLAASESIVEGRQYRLTPPDTDKGEIAEVTLEQRYADRMNIEVGDQLTFTIQSIPIEGKVVGLRKVRWNSFDPNFFIQFQPGVLEDAPKTFVAAIGAASDVKKVALQQELVQKFPNVSQIDISKVITKIFDIVDKMGVILMIMALLTTLAGLIVLFSIANYQAQARQKDINLLKILGLRFSEIRKSIYLEFLVITGTAAFVGSLISFGITWVLNDLIFQSDYYLSLLIPGAIYLVVIASSMVLAHVASSKVLSQKPRFFLEAF